MALKRLGDLTVSFISITDVIEYYYHLFQSLNDPQSLQSFSHPLFRDRVIICTLLDCMVFLSIIKENHLALTFWSADVLFDPVLIDDPLCQSSKAVDDTLFGFGQIQMRL